MKVSLVVAILSAIVATESLVTADKLVAKYHDEDGDYHHEPSGYGDGREGVDGLKSDDDSPSGDHDHWWSHWFGGGNHDHDSDSSKKSLGKHYGGGDDEGHDDSDHHDDHGYNDHGSKKVIRVKLMLRRGD